MRPWIVIPLVLAAMGLLMFAAVGADCRRIAAEYQAAADVVDAEMRKLEDRWFQLQIDGKMLDAKPDAMNVPRSPDARHELFRKYVDIQQNYPTERPAQPDWPQVYDELAGLVNRWTRLEPDYAARRAELDAYLATWRGRFASETRRGEPRG